MKKVFTVVAVLVLFLSTNVTFASTTYTSKGFIVESKNPTAQQQMVQFESDDIVDAPYFANAEIYIEKTPAQKAAAASAARVSQNNNNVAYIR